MHTSKHPLQSKQSQEEIESILDLMLKHDVLKQTQQPATMSKVEHSGIAAFEAVLTAGKIHRAIIYLKTI